MVPGGVLCMIMQKLPLFLTGLTPRILPVKYLISFVCCLNWIKNILSNITASIWILIAMTLLSTSLSSMYANVDDSIFMVLMERSCWHNYIFMLFWSTTSLNFGTFSQLCNDKLLFWLYSKFLWRIRNKKEIYLLLGI